MFITLLKFAGNRAAASVLMAAHNEWIAKGFADGVFLGVCSLTPAVGGAILAHGEAVKTTRRVSPSILSSCMALSPLKSMRWIRSERPRR